MNLEHAIEQKRQWNERNLARSKVIENIPDVRSVAQATYRENLGAMPTKRQLSSERTTLIGAVAEALNVHGIYAAGLAGRIARGKKLTATQFYALPQVYRTA